MIEMNRETVIIDDHGNTLTKILLTTKSQEKQHPFPGARPIVIETTKRTRNQQGAAIARIARTEIEVASEMVNIARQRGDQGLPR